MHRVDGQTTDEQSDLHVAEITLHVADITLHVADVDPDTYPRHPLEMIVRYNIINHHEMHHAVQQIHSTLSLYNND